MGTHTYAILKLSRAAYDEIAEKLRAASYDHAFDGELIDMHGLAVSPEDPPLADSNEEKTNPDR
jgi:hypothetical protein